MIQQFILLLNAQVFVSYDTAVYIVAQCSSICIIYDTAVFIVAQVGVSLFVAQVCVSSIVAQVHVSYDTAVYIVAQVGVSLDTIRRVALRHPPFHALLFGNSMFMFNTLTINNNRKI